MVLSFKRFDKLVDKIGCKFLYAAAGLCFYDANSV